MGRWVLLLWLSAAMLAAAQTETVSGTVANPDGSGFNGSFVISLAKTTVVNTCVSPAQVVPFPGITVKVTAGTFPSTSLLPTPCLSPVLPYFVRVVDSQNRQIYTDNWYLPQMAGGTVNIGDLGTVKLASGIAVSVPQAIVANPSGTQTITQPGGTTLNINGTLAQSGGTAAFAGAVFVSSGPIGGYVTIYRCTSNGTLPTGALTTQTTTCGSAADTGLRTH